MSASEYGEALWNAATKLVQGKTYIARVENEKHDEDTLLAYCPEDLEPPTGVNLVLEESD